MARDTHTPTTNELATAFAADFGYDIDRFVENSLPAHDSGAWPNSFLRQKQRELRAAVAQMLVSDGDDCLRDLIEAYRVADYALTRNATDPDEADAADDAIADFARVAEDVAEHLEGEICRKGDAA